MTDPHMSRNAAAQMRGIYAILQAQAGMFYQRYPGTKEQRKVAAERLWALRELKRAGIDVAEEIAKLRAWPKPGYYKS